jgi:hypothetical protein
MRLKRFVYRSRRNIYETVMKRFKRKTSLGSTKTDFRIILKLILNQFEVANLIYLLDLRFLQWFCVFPFNEVSYCVYTDVSWNTLKKEAVHSFETEVPTDISSPSITPEVGHFAFIWLILAFGPGLLLIRQWTLRDRFPQYLYICPCCSDSHRQDRPWDLPLRPMFLLLDHHMMGWGTLVGVPLSSILLEKSDGQVGGRWVCVVITALFTNRFRPCQIRIQTTTCILCFVYWLEVWINSQVEWHTVRKHTEAWVIASKEIGLEVNAEKTKYMVMSRDWNLTEWKRTYS